jgi:hypothetical protein
VGCHSGAQRHVAMARRSRDRVTIDLCGIGDAARAAAQARNTTLAVFARQALVAALPANVDALPPRAEPRGEPGGTTIKLSVRLSSDDSAVLATQAAMLGLSQAHLIALFIRSAELPRRSIERDADRAALRASTEQLATLSVDLQQFMRLLRRGSSEVERYRKRIESVDTDIRAHLERASTFLANSHRGAPP